MSITLLLRAPGRGLLIVFFLFPLTRAPAEQKTPAPADPAAPGSVELGETIVTGRSSDAFERRLRRLPGMAGRFAGPEGLEAGRRIGHLGDVLERSPSLYIESRFGGSEMRLLSRGSGINQTFEGRGVSIFRNGMPLMEADGFTRTQFIDPMLVQEAEVYPGANAFTLGSATLGGAVNLKTPTGHTASPLRVRSTFGSDNFFRGFASTGLVLGESGFDLFASVSGLDTDGFRDQSREDFLRFYGNLGYRPEPGVTHRLHLGYQKIDLELPGSLTDAQLNRDPRQASGLWENAPAFRDFENVFRAGWETRIEPDEDRRFSFSFSWQQFEMLHGLPNFIFNPGAAFNAFNSSQIITTEQDELGLFARYEHSGELWGRPADWTAGLRLAWGQGETRMHLSGLGTRRPGPLARIEDGTALTAVVFAGQALELTEGFTLTTGLQITAADRENEVNQVDPTEPLGGGIEAEASYFGANPRLGFTWEPVAGADWQLFGNVSRSFEPPTLFELANPVEGTLDAQRAWTGELGTRGSRGPFAWSLAGFYSHVEDEILTVETPAGSGNFESGNAGETVHAGVELGLDWRQPLGWAAGALGEEADTLTARLTWQLNEFFFEDDAAFGDNRLPGVPEHRIRFELLYEHPSGFYAGPNLEATAGRAYVDFANTLENDDFAILGFRAGWRRGRWHLFLDARNVLDTAFASNTGIVADAGGADQAVFNPGAPATVFAGVEWRF